MAPLGSSLVSALLARIRSLLRGVFRRSRMEAEMSEEFLHHIAMRTEDLVRRGLSRKEATRQAHLEFGHVETHKRHARAARGLRLLDQVRFSWIDVRLGLRMLVKYPGLSLAAVFALAVGIPVGMAPMHLAKAVEAPLPEDPENRIRAIRYWDPVTTAVVTPTYYELELWTSELVTFEALGAFRTTSYNVASDDRRAPSVRGAEVTPSTFDILGTPPMMGRALDRSDQAVGSPFVVVIGHDLWRSRFGSDPHIIGRTVRIAQVPHVVVGVMPAGFLFPGNEQLWLPLQEERPSGPGRGVGLRVFGRLASRVTDQEAQAELSSVATNSEGALPESRARLRAEVVPFGLLYMGIPRAGLKGMPEFYFFQLLALALLLVACVNVAMLIFARTVTQFRALAIRAALGASRTRIVSQVFVETLVLAVLAAGLGVLSIDWALGRIRLSALVGEVALPYWLTLGVTAEAVGWALILAALSAAVAGVAPALRITSKKVDESIRRASVGRSGIRFGGGTSALVIADVAIAVVVIGFATAVVESMTEVARSDEQLAGIAAEEFLAVELRLPARALRSNGQADSEGRAERLGETQRALVTRLEAEPGVKSVTVADALPRMNHRSRMVELEGFERTGGLWVRTARVDVDFFRTLSRPILAGRGFDRADLEGEAAPVIVNTVFVDRLLGGGDAIGRRVRFINPSGDEQAPWHEIVGVVGHLGMNMVNPAGEAGVYIPMAPGEIHPAQLAIHLGPSPEGFATRLRELVAEVDPAVVMGTPVVLSRVYQGDWYLMIAVTAGLALLVGILIALAVSGIYAMMSFSVSERTREIGIRTALGARRSRLVVTILRRSLTQIGIGALLGTPLAAEILLKLREESGRSGSPFLALSSALGLAMGIVTVVGLLSCVAPTRRALGIQANDALSAEN